MRGAGQWRAFAPDTKVARSVVKCCPEMLRSNVSMWRNSIIISILLVPKSSSWPLRALIGIGKICRLLLYILYTLTTSNYLIPVHAVSWEKRVGATRSPIRRRHAQHSNASIVPPEVQAELFSGQQARLPASNHPNAALKDAYRYVYRQRGSLVKYDFSC